MWSCQHCHALPGQCSHLQSIQQLYDTLVPAALQLQRQQQQQQQDGVTPTAAAAAQTKPPSKTPWKTPPPLFNDPKTPATAAPASGWQDIYNDQEGTRHCLNTVTTTLHVSWLSVESLHIAKLDSGPLKLVLSTLDPAEAALSSLSVI